MSENDKSVRPKRESRLMPHDAKELQKVSDYAVAKGSEVKKLTDDFSKKGFLGLFWDSKVPEKDKKFYYFFSFTRSNRENVLAEIKKYQDFYAELGEAMRKVRNLEHAGDEETNSHVIIHDLNITLKKMAEAAEVGEIDTASSTIYKLHKSFIKEHEKLENMIKRVECVALKDGFKRATNGLEESTQSINNLGNVFRATQERYDELCVKFDKLMQLHEDLIEEQKTLLNDNKKGPAGK